MPSIKGRINRIGGPHVLHIAGLAAIFGAAVWGFLHFRGFEALQLYVISTAVLAYVGWGVVFHYFRRNLSWGMVLEYFLVGALVLLLFFWLLLFA